MESVLKLGSRFQSFSELEPVLKKYQQQQQVPYHVYCSVTIAKYNSAAEGRQLPECLRYANFTFSCKHYGQVRSNSKGERPNQNSFKCGCKARVRFRSEESSGTLVVTAIDDIHNHVVSEEFSDCYPENRRLTKEEEGQAAALIDLEVRPAILQNVVRTSTLKCTTLQDIRNVKQRLVKQTEKMKAQGDETTGVDHEVEKLMEELEDTKKNDPGAQIIIGTKEDSTDVAYLFWSSSQMQCDFNLFPEVLSIDNTYNTNAYKMPLTIFMCQDRHGVGKVAAYALLCDEKQDILGAVLSTFADCHKAVTKKIKSVLVDKDLNTILRIFEVLPDVQVHLCRFHVINIFQREIKKKMKLVTAEVQDKAVSLTKKMLYTEKAEEYDQLYDELAALKCTDFLNYFNNNWHKSPTIWKGHERLMYVTFGLTTTNRNESLHGKLKSILHRRRSLADCFSKLRLFQQNDVLRSRIREFHALAKVPYGAQNKDSTIRSIVNLCTPFVSKMIREQYTSSLQMEALPGEFDVDTEKCSCTFFRSRGFPCVHIFFSRRLKDCELFSESDVNEKWKRLTSDKDDSNRGEDCHSDPDVPEDKDAVQMSSNPMKSGGKTLNKSEKYNKFLGLCAKAGNLASQCGGKQFANRCKVIEDVISSWDRNEEVIIITNQSEKGSAYETIPVVDNHEDKGQTTSIISVADNHEDKGQTTSIISVADNHEDKGQNTSIISVADNHEDQGQNTLRCRCGEDAVSHVPTFGPNKGKCIYKCAKTMPDVPCSFFTVCQDRDSVDPSSGGEILQKSVDDCKGMQKFSIGDTVPMLTLKVPLKVKGQPKTNLQRSFSKTGKQVHNIASRTLKASSIPDKDVKKIGPLEWQFLSQTNCNMSYVITKRDISDRCFCVEKRKCSHCFTCNCPDRFSLCKHIVKVMELETSEKEETSLETAPELPSLDEDSQMFLNIPENVLSGNEATQTISVSERNCAVCTSEGPPSPNGAHKCCKCGVPVHAFGCGKQIVDAEEGFGRNDKLCWPCFDHAADTNPTIQSADMPKDKEYHCFGCKSKLVRLMCSESSANFGRAYYSCTTKASSKCLPFAFWAPTKSPSKSSSIRKFLSQGTSAGPSGTSSIGKTDNKRVPSQSNCVQCQYSKVSDLKCNSCKKVVHDSMDCSQEIEGQRLCHACRTGTTDFIGFNAYFDNVAAFKTNSSEPSLAGRPGAVGLEFVPFVTASANLPGGPEVLFSEIDPRALRSALVWAWQTYHVPLVVTENGFGDSFDLRTHDQKRAAYFSAYLRTLVKTMNDFQMKVIGYSAWSLIDCYEWSAGLTGRPFGLVHVDYEGGSLARSLKDSASFWITMAESGVVPLVEDSASAAAVASSLLVAAAAAASLLRQ